MKFFIDGEEIAEKNLQNLDYEIQNKIDSYIDMLAEEKEITQVSFTKNGLYINIKK